VSKDSKRLSDLVKSAKENAPSTSSLKDPDSIARAEQLLRDFDPSWHRLGAHQWLRQMQTQVACGISPSLGQAEEICRLMEDDRPSSLSDPASLGIRLPHQRTRRRRKG
jgi:hypothetical protein